MKPINSLLMLFGRWCIAAIFIFGGLGKFINYDATAAYMAAKGLAPIPILLVISALVEIIGGCSLILGYKTRWGALLLLLFLIPTTLIFHDFWNVTGEGRTLQLIEFLKNLAIFGGLLYVLVKGAGSIACDVFHKHKEPEHH